MSRLIVKNLPGLITKEKLYEIFSEKGVVTDVQLKYTKDGVFRRFGFIGFQKPECAEAAKAALDKSFINTSRIQVEVCTELGDPQKPKAWSKHAAKNIEEKNKVTKVKEDDDGGKKKKKKMKKDSDKTDKIKDPVVKELLKNHENDELFKEFMKVNFSDIPIATGNDVNDEKGDGDEAKQSNTYGKKINSDDDDDDDNDDNNDDAKFDENMLANQDIPDSKYIKLKSGQDLNLAIDKMEEKEGVKKIGRKATDIELYTIKIQGLQLRVKKSQIKEFLRPLKPFTIRRALKIKGIVYCGFKTEKEMRQALMKNRTFLNGRRVYVTEVKKRMTMFDKEKEMKWKREAERLEGLETVAESGRIFVRNLPYTVSEDELQKRFESYGPISEIVFPIDSFTRKPKGFAIVTFLIPEHACKAFNELDGTIFCGRMLHLLPALPKNEKKEDDSEGLMFKQKKLNKEQAKINSSANWNTFFVGENALAEVVAATYNTTKENVLEDKESGAAVRLALGESQFVNKMKEFLRENDVSLESFENMAICPRSKRVILVKNLPFGSTGDELREKFAKFGVLKRVVLPPSGVAALVEFVEPSEARTAFRKLSYSKFKHVPLYLEWAPENVFNKDAAIGKDGGESKESTKEEVKNEIATQEEVVVPEEGTIIFVKSLNFSTDENSLRKHFESCGPVASVTIARKKDPKNPGISLSMGYGFVTFIKRESADEALKKLQFTNLDNYRIELKRSNRTVASEVPSARKTGKGNEKPSAKILIRNVPFQATKKEIGDLFKVFGEIKAIRLPKKMVGTGSHRGFCFVEYNTVQDAKRAFAALSESTHLYGRRLVLEWAATDDDVDTLREKTAQQFNAGSSLNSSRKKISLDDMPNDE